MQKGWFGHGSVCTVETLGIVLVCRSETSVEQLGIDCETAKAAQDTMEAVLGERVGISFILDYLLLSTKWTQRVAKCAVAERSTERQSLMSLAGSYQWILDRRVY